MSISFDAIPSTRVPFLYAEFNAENAQQGLGEIPYAALLIGGKLSGGTKAPLTLVSVTSAAQATSYFGAGSQLARMAAAWFQNNSTTALYAVAIADDGSWVAASSLVTFDAAPTAAGTVAFYIGGQKVAFGVTSADTAVTCAAALTAAINAATYLPVTAVQGTSSNTHKVTITAKHKGLEGNSIDLRWNFADADVKPTGLAMTIPEMASGTGTPDLSTVWAAIEDDQFQIMVMPYRDSTTLTAVNTELEDRWGPLRQQEGTMYIGHSGNHSTLLSFGNSLNSKHISVQPSFGSPTPEVEWAAGIAAIAAFNLNIDPARPLQNLTLNGVKTPPKSTRFSNTERNLLLQDGISTTRVASDGTVILERIITTYQVNSFGAPDIAYLDVNTPATLGYLRATFRNTMLRKFPRHKLANDGTQFGPGQAIVTPKVAKAECISIFRQWEAQGLVENVDQFIAGLIVERNANDPNRLDFLLPPDLVNQLRVMAAKIAFLL